jgi:ubiquitin-protein ligase
MLTGPEGTPYHGGCFLFDVLFPARYPDVPPLLSLDTTGGGRARLNPNLYADGKVCLSLLGTWHGSDASEKWDADAANLWRVLVSVQGMILVADPYFNEPGVEAVRGTPEGDAASARYNARLSLNVVRHAMNGMLDAPPPGFEEVVKEHFRLVGRSALEAAAKAAEEAARGSADAALAAQLRAEVEGLRGRLVKLLAEE